MDFRSLLRDFVVKVSIAYCDLMSFVSATAEDDCDSIYVERTFQEV